MADFVRQRIGIFGGSFNPVHLGHVALAVQLQEVHRLDSLFIIPTNCSPFKTTKVYVDAKHRFSMCKKAFQSVSKCRVLDIEINRPGISYTVDTIQDLEDRKLVSKNDKLFLLLGQDSYASFSRWKKVDAILERVTVVVARRNQEVVPQKQVQNVLFTDTAMFDISATEIRWRLKRGLFCGHLLPQNVYTYIKRHALYYDKTQ